MKDLRGIIVNATSEMLDNPDEYGIYPTGKFYDRLEAEVTEFMELNPTQTNLYDLMLQTVKNSSSVSIPLQNAVAKYIDWQASPRTSIKSDQIAKSLFGPKEDL